MLRVLRLHTFDGRFPIIIRHSKGLSDLFNDCVASCWVAVKRDTKWLAQIKLVGRQGLSYSEVVAMLIFVATKAMYRGAKIATERMHHVDFVNIQSGP